MAPILKIKTVTDKIIVESSQNTRVSTLPLESRQRRESKNMAIGYAGNTGVEAAWRRPGGGLMGISVP